MSSVLNYFNNDFKFGILTEYSFDTTVKGVTQKVSILERVSFKADSPVRTQVYYVPLTPDALFFVMKTLQDIDHLRYEADAQNITSQHPGELLLGIHKNTYANKIYFYTEQQFSSDQIAEIKRFALEKGYVVSIRSPYYVLKQLEIETPLAFISHDSNDKDLVARPLAEGLSNRFCTVWYDEYSLKVGESLRESIEKGIKEARKCILVLSPDFLNNTGWAKKEFNSIFTREMIFESKIIIPIWHNVTEKEVYEYSPSLADTYGVKWPDPKLPTVEYQKQVNQKIDIIKSSIAIPEEV